MLFQRIRRKINLKRSGRDQIERRPLLSSLPIRIHFEVNDWCNLRCIMCARQGNDVPRDTGNLPPEILERISPWLPFAHYVGLAGNGEPFLHPRLFDILEKLARNRCVPAIVTNATLLTPERLDHIMSLGPLILNVSMDGATKKTFDSIRVGADFDRVTQSLRHLHDMKIRRNTPFPIINFLVCVLKENQHELPAIIDLASSLGVLKVDFQTVFPFTHEGRNRMITSLDEIEHAVTPAIEKAAGLGIQASLAPLRFGLHERLVRRGENPEIPRPLFCRNIWQTMHVGLDGAVRFCCFWTGKSIGNLMDEPLPRLWNHPEFQDLRRRIVMGDLPDDCRDCHVLDIHNPAVLSSEIRSEMDHL
ncbi:MAG TPA: radical SAM protein [Candidatus Sumerlaeota bacterium]|nr:radical SAM protein [Candidatus Sumerlaeota bacterium]